MLQIALLFFQLLDWTGGVATHISATTDRVRTDRVLAFQPKLTNNTGQTVTLRYVRLVLDGTTYDAIRVDSTGKEFPLVDYSWAAGVQIQLYIKLGNGLTLNDIRNLSSASIRYQLNTNSEQSVTVTRQSARTMLDDSISRHGVIQ